MRHKASSAHLSGATKANPGFFQLPTTSQPVAKQGNKQFIPKDPVRCFSRLTSKQQTPLRMAKTCQAVFRDKNLHQQLTCFLEFGSQTLESGRKDWRFLYPQGPDEQELDRSALAPGCAGSNVRMQLELLNCSGTGGEGPHSGADT